MYETHAMPAVCVVHGVPWAHHHVTTNTYDGATNAARASAVSKLSAKLGVVEVEAEEMRQLMVDSHRTVASLRAENSALQKKLLHHSWIEAAPPLTIGHTF